MNTYHHSGAMGDMIYSFAAIKKLGPGKIYLRGNDGNYNAYNLYTTMINLCDAQEYITEVLEAPASLPIFSILPEWGVTHNLDKFRYTPGIGQASLVLNHFWAFNLPEDNWYEPWLTIPDSNLFVPSENFVVINKTERYGDPFYDWNHAFDLINNEYSDCQRLFLGAQKEWELFEAKYPGKTIYYPTEDMLHAAQVIKKSKAFFGGQSSCLAIAQGIGHNYYLEVAPGHNNCVWNTPNEHLLNR